MPSYEGNEWQTCSINSAKHICEKNKFNKNISPKLWLTESFRFYSNKSTPQNFASEIIPKLYRCNVSRLIISQQYLTFEEFLFLTPNVTNLHFHYIHLRYGSGKPVEFETIVSNLPKIQIFKYKFFREDSSVSTKTAKNLLKIQHFKNPKSLSIQNLPSKFDFNLFYPFIYKNEQIKFDVTFRQPLPEKYKNSIQAYENETEYNGNNALNLS
uniref:Uncharacterized protein n=1 Tax=Panagrolaimus davidi TaxID=227884 RepID=A0A914QV99_9BILA